MDLKDTIGLMTSADYKHRFRAEYYQTRTRYNLLCRMLDAHKAGTLDFTPTCPIELLERQKKYMRRYLGCLEQRAEIESIEL